MLGKKVGAIGLLRDDSQVQFITIYWIIHREHLISKYLKYPHIMKTVLHIVNYIPTNGKMINTENLLKELKKEKLPNYINFFGLLYGYLATTY